MVWFVTSPALRKKKRALRRKARLLFNRWIARMFMAHKNLREQHDTRLAQNRDRGASPRGFGPGERRLARSLKRERSRDRDRTVKRSAQEEQLWKVRADAMKERTRDRRQEAMDRWQMMATSGGAFRGR